MSAGQFLLWHDLFVVIDDGAIPLEGYVPIEKAMQQQAKANAAGITCLCILPKGARPPPQDIKDRVKSLLTNLGPSLRCLAYVIEDTGFKAVAARTALIAMKVFLPRPYPVIVETSLEGALTKLLPHLAKGATAKVRPIADVIAENRASWDKAQPGGGSQLGKR
jgi:hypothetical protein